MPEWVAWVGRGLLLAACLLLVWRLIDVVMLVALAMLIAAAFSPLVRWLDEHRMPHPLSVSLCFAALLVALATLGYFLVPVLIQQAIQFSDSAPYLADQFQILTERWAHWRARVPFIPEFADLVQWASGLLRQSAFWALGLASNFLNVFFKSISLLFLGPNRPGRRPER